MKGDKNVCTYRSRALFQQFPIVMRVIWRHPEQALYSNASLNTIMKAWTAKWLNISFVVVVTFAGSCPQNVSMSLADGWSWVFENGEQLDVWMTYNHDHVPFKASLYHRTFKADSQWKFSMKQ